MANPNDELIQRFYAAFAEGRGDSMAACYTDDAHFSDPVFPDLNGAEPGQMWRMLTGASDDLRIELVEHEAGEETGSARWQAHYTFTQTGRPVTNDVRATFRFRDGLIAAGRSPRTPVGVFARATRPDAQAAVGVLADLPALVRRIDGGPALLVIGDVVAHSAPWRAARLAQTLPDLMMAAE